jgi:predicted DNA-binding transcriptional regulator YafY
MLDAFNLFNSLHLADDLTTFIYFEDRRPQGTENLYGLLHAIKNKQQINFTYEKFWEDEATKRTAEPYALKEFKNRWYVMAKDVKDNKLKSFALDRLTELEITNKKFQISDKQNIEQTYQYCFGISSPYEGTEPQEIILSFNAFQGKYIKTLPLHSTQEILVDNEDELRIKLHLFITFEFIMELLSFGSNVKVLQPQILIETIKQSLQESLKYYRK